MKIEMEFQGLEELVRAFEKAASDDEIKETNQRIVEKSEPVVKRIMSGKVPKSADISKSGRGFGTKSSMSAHAADEIPIGKVKVKTCKTCVSTDGLAILQPTVYRKAAFSTFRRWTHSRMDEIITP